VRRFVVHCLSDQRGDVVDIGERSSLLSVAEDRERRARQRLSHEDSNDISEGIVDVLPGSVDVVGPKDNEWQVEHAARDHEVLLNRKFRDPVGIARLGNARLRRRHLMGRRLRR